MQLNKYLAQAGICSRRKAVELIKQGLVRVNGTIVTEPAYEVAQKDLVMVGKKRVMQEEKKYVLLNKPKGYITTVSDEKGRRTVMDLLGKSIKQRLYPIGRLDINTTGVLLLTNDGELAQRLSHPRYTVAKVYHATLDRALDERNRKSIQAGIRLSDGRAKVDAISMPFGVKKNQVRVTLHSGRYRIVRRIFEHLGYQVRKLDRVRYAHLDKKGLPVGMWRMLSRKELAQLKKAVSG